MLFFILNEAGDGCVYLIFVHEVAKVSLLVLETAPSQELPDQTLNDDDRFPLTLRCD